jgi:hypothetical protein
MRNLILAACACVLAACSSDNADTTAAPTPMTTNAGSGGISFPGLSAIFGSDDTSEDNTPQLGVNGYLWRATLDTLNFMPLASADPVGGVVISDWYAAPDKPDEHVKVTVYILDKRLRADAIKVSVFRQVRTPNGWTDAAVNPDTGVKLENAILARARELHLAATP